MGNGGDNQLETGSLIISEWQHLHNVFRSQCGSRLMTESEGVFQKLDDFRFGFQIFRSVSAFDALGQLIARDGAPVKIVGGGNVPYLQGERANSFVVGTLDIQ